MRYSILLGYRLALLGEDLTAAGAVATGEFVEAGLAFPVGHVARGESLPLGVRALGAVQLVETDQLQREVLDSVEQTVAPGVIADCGDDAGAAVAALDRGIA